ncbi:MAG TPA: LEA type 2 family protein [Gemmatimonadales bacterium]|nr:LEA type 2 family protein [Gemmatimonadales bacterium]
MAPLALAAALGGCTPLGLWVYTEPQVALSGIQVALDADAEPLGMVLQVINPNSFDLTVTHVEARLQLDSATVGQVVQANGASVPERGEAQVHVALPASDSLRRALSAQLRAGTHHYAVSGMLTLATPIGKRRIPFAAAGQGSFGQQRPL